KMPVRTMCVPQTSSDTPATMLRIVSIATAGHAGGRSPRQRVRLHVGKAFHRFLHAFLVAQSGILDPAERRQLESIARHFAHVDRADVELSDEARDVVQAIGAYRRRQAVG